MYVQQVLEGASSRRFISKVAQSCMGSTSFTTRVELADGETEDFLFMSLRRILIALCEEAELFRISMLEATQRGGACMKHTSSRH